MRWLLSLAAFGLALTPLVTEARPPVTPPRHAAKIKRSGRDRHAPTRSADPTLGVAPPREWYGAQILIVDGVNLGVALIGSAALESAGPLALGSIGYALGGPFVHWAHHQGSSAGLSFTLRLALPLVSGGLAYGIAAGNCRDAPRPPDEEYGNRLPCEVDVGILGFALGMVAAPLLDASLLAWSPSPKSEGGGARWLPTLAVSRTGATLGLVGAL